MKKLVIASLLAACFVSSAIAGPACRHIEFTQGASMYHGEEVKTSEDVMIQGVLTLCDLKNGKAKLTVPASPGGLPEQSEILQKAGEVYILIGRPEGESRVTTIETWHFSDAGEVNYTKSINGIAPVKNYDTGEMMNWNHVDMSLGKWWFN